jgi:hypothetical protein
MSNLRGELLRASVAFLLIAICLSVYAQTAAAQTNSAQQNGVTNPAPTPAPGLQPPSYASASSGASEGQFEQPPVVNISEWLPVSMQSGPDGTAGPALTN